MILSTARDRLHLLAAAFAGAAALSCGDRDGDSGLSCDRDPPLTYENFGQGFMGVHCAGCHSALNPAGHRKGAPAGVDLDTYEGVLQWAYRSEVRAIGDNPGMPPGGGPSEAERERLDEWFRCSVFPEIEGDAGGAR